ncbi:hypothetical protein ACQ4PT_009933 [Festuca glaucescens]
MVFGQVVIGPPGCGKTTYCNGMSQFLSLIRSVVLYAVRVCSDVWENELDSRCVFLTVVPRYECAINIEDLIKLSDVMSEHSLGPNGGLVYCMDYLEKNIDWLEEKLKPLIEAECRLPFSSTILQLFVVTADHYLLFDFPGQLELFSLHTNARNIINKLIKKLNLRLTAVHLVDAHLCCDPGKYLVLIFLFSAFNLDFYTDVQDLSYLQYHLDQDPRSAKYRKLTKELCNVIDDFSIVNFTTLDIQDKESVGNLVKLIDKSNGYIFSTIDSSAVEFSKIEAAPLDWDYYRTAAVQEKYMKDDEVVEKTSRMQ